MANELLLKTLIDGYNAIAYTHKYWFGFVDRKNVYACQVTSEVLPYILKIDDAGRDQGKSLRYKAPNKQMRELLKVNAESIILLCSEKCFKDEVENSIYNKGEIFEKLLTEHFGQTWVKDHVPFIEAGDIEINNVPYQIKYINATFCTEKSLASLTKKVNEKKKGQG